MTTHQIVLIPGDGIGPAISAYHQGAMEEVHMLSPGDSVELGHVKVLATPAAHSDPSTVGFRLGTTNGEVGYAYSVADVIAKVQAAYASGDYETTKDEFAYENEMGCPLD